MDEAALTVTQAMALAKRALEALRLTVVGEVSEVSDRPGYKAVYFSLADGCAVMPCLMWRDAYCDSGVQLRPGMMVELTGSYTVYAPKGRLQFQARTLAAAGEGVLRSQVAGLARRLEAEGLMRPERKRHLPAHPARIGVVTSPRGKAVHDVIRTLRRRWPMAEVMIAGVAVEGVSAVQNIVAGLRAVAEAGAEVLLLCRGGGSYEDLMPFNSEEVARAVASCPVPVITGIGHEPDDTISDMVADLRASTPTAAAEKAAPDSGELERAVRHGGMRLGRALSHGLQRSAHALSALAVRPVLRDPRWSLAMRAQSLDLAAEGLGRSLPACIAREREAASSAETGLLRAGERVLERVQAVIAQDAARLHGLSPLAILSRGYAVCYDESGRNIVRSSREVSPGDAVRVRLGRGALGCRVETIEAEA